MPGSSELYRPNAAIIYQRADGRVLLCERVKPAGAWQFPQGGIKKGESALDAACREGMEEQVSALMSMRSWQPADRTVIIILQRSASACF